MVFSWRNKNRNEKRNWKSSEKANEEEVLRLYLNDSSRTRGVLEPCRGVMARRVLGYRTSAVTYYSAYGYGDYRWPWPGRWLAGNLGRASRVAA